MITTLFCDIAQRLKDTGLFSVVYEYCDMVNRGGNMTRPMYYKGKLAGYVDVQNFDVNGLAYIRKTSNARVQLDTKYTKVTSCIEDSLDNVIITMPLRLVAVVPKDNLNDSPLVDDLFVADLLGVLQGDYKLTAEDMDAVSVKVLVNSYDTNAMGIWNAENRGVEFDEAIVYRFSYVAIDFSAEIKGKLSCLQNCLKDGYNLA
jgi:hypothetical protein